MTRADLVAAGVFLASWLFYHVVIEGRKLGPRSLNARINAYRHAWMKEMLQRDNRMVDVQVMAALHQGSAFFASTSLIAVGGALSLVRAGSGMTELLSGLPFGTTPTQAMWELKVVGLAVIFVYAFFKFAWAYRLFNYAAILFGATPTRERLDETAYRMAERTGNMIVVAGRHFNRGQRAFFFALAYLGWFLGPYVFTIATVGTIVVISWRQFASDALAAVVLTENSDMPPPIV